MRSGNEYAVTVYMLQFLSFRSNRNARIITGQFVKPRLPYASHFRLKAHKVRLISGATAFLTNKKMEQFF